ncbi:hypothetical protein [Flavonifractor plautii]|uniref:hypothetical protein n=1 Tax=Flavonifractor plautii TaxID=292800 RepID=UPI0012BAD090|nr:hypothetical protein [Flavonifractor plautii]QIA30926.1 hypothetical protein GXM20_10260 [Flavonifractor plautii]
MLIKLPPSFVKLIVWKTAKIVKDANHLKNPVNIPQGGFHALPFIAKIKQPGAARSQETGKGTAFVCAALKCCTAGRSPPLCLISRASVIMFGLSLCVMIAEVIENGLKSAVFVHFSYKQRTFCIQQFKPTGK